MILNQDQFMSLLRAVLTIAGSLIASHHWISGSDWDAAAGAIMTLAGIGWGIYVQSKAVKVSSVASLPEVKKVELCPTPEGLSLAQAIGPTPPSAQVTVAPK